MKILKEIPKILWSRRVNINENYFGNCYINYVWNNILYPFLLVRMWNSTAIIENSLAVTKNIKHRIAVWSLEFHFQVYVIKGWKHLLESLYMHVHTTLFTVAKKQANPNVHLWSIAMNRYNTILFIKTTVASRGWGMGWHTDSCHPHPYKNGCTSKLLA